MLFSSIWCEINVLAIDTYVYIYVYAYIHNFTQIFAECKIKNITFSFLLLSEIVVYCFFPI